jgi:hypothetical protein
VRSTCIRSNGGSIERKVTDAYDEGDDITTPQKRMFMMLTPSPDRKSLLQDHNTPYHPTYLPTQQL